MASKWQGEAARYSGIGIQAALIVVGFVWLGRSCDSWLELKRPLCTAGGALLGCVLVVVWLIRKFTPPSR